MYLVNQTKEQARERAWEISRAGFGREAFIYSITSYETALYRVVRSLAYNQKVSSREVFDDFLIGSGHNGLKKLWSYLDPERVKLKDRLEQTCGRRSIWNDLDEAQKLRNRIVHGGIKRPAKKTVKEKTWTEAEQLETGIEACWDGVFSLCQIAEEFAIKGPFDRADHWGES